MEVFDGEQYFFLIFVTLDTLIFQIRFLSVSGLVLNFQDFFSTVFMYNH